MSPVLLRIRLIVLIQWFAFPAFCQTPKLTLATYTYADNNRLGNIQPLADVLSQKLGMPVQTRSYENVAGFIAGIEAGEVDLALISTFGYLLLINRGASPYTPVAALQVPPGVRDNYKTALIAHASLPVNRMADLTKQAAQYRMTFVSETSTSGNLIPRAYLYANGLPEPERQFKAVAFSKTHANGLTQVLERKTDLAAFGSEEYHKAVRKDSTLKNRIKMVWESEEIPLGPVLLKNTLDVSLQKKITDVLLALHTENHAVLVALRSGWSEARQAEKFRPIDRAFYQSYQQRIGAPKTLIEQFANLIR
ncbi:phosphate/phosphite/phosphonate ABC transporter substrate-binding protein [Larkinella humicola]|uniref:Phosphate/phosphite/phosphonate ABC transporter substrate-binding protein n=1 Tax=Larkinella humicola TaxID=2607654 RepID=A0A5N1JQ16_9BACT|nr:phosphate/phosphite/phosphonate ABC transporter substrate-binding protein [Larkinella humicola]KAA9355237.1 phosphate/phosphite/phosphonate ABC transporter substrate-binding protein [Larkinella humicola]